LLVSDQLEQGELAFDMVMFAQRRDW
jgi:hypothetical protein